MSRKTLVIIMILVVTASVAAYFAVYSRQKGLVLTGIVTTHEVIVSSQIQGRLAQLLVKEGDTVTQGQLLARIDPGELQADQAFYAHSQQSSAAQVVQAEASLRFQEQQTRDSIRQALAALASTEAQQSSAEATLNQAKLDYGRIHALFQQRIDSASQDDQARTNYQSAAAQLESLNKQVEAQQAAVALAQSNVEQIVVRENQLRAGQRQLEAATSQTRHAKIILGYTEIRAPISGLIAERVALQGEVVNVSQPIVTIINPDDLWVRADVEETYITQIRLGEQMPVRFPGGMVRTGTVFFRGVDADFATQRDVSRTKRDIKTFEIRLRVDNSDRRIYPGLTAFVIAPLGGT